MIKNLLYSASLLLFTSPCLAERREYVVTRNGSQVGTSSVEISEADGGLRIEYEVDIDISVAFFTLYDVKRKQTLVVDSEKRLVSAESLADEDGEKYRVQVKRSGEDITVTVNGRSTTYPADSILMTSLHPFVVTPSAGPWLQLAKGEVKEYKIDRESDDTYRLISAGKDEIIKYGADKRPVSYIIKSKKGDVIISRR